MQEIDAMLATARHALSMGQAHGDIKPLAQEVAQGPCELSHTDPVPPKSHVISDDSNDEEHTEWFLGDQNKTILTKNQESQTIV